MFRNLSFKWKLRLGMVATSALAVILACALMLAYELASSRDALTREMRMLSHVVSEQSAAAVAFDDRKAAEEVLFSLKAAPQVSAACLYNAKGERFAAFLRPGSQANPIPTRPETDGVSETDDSLTVFAPIFSEKERVGTSYLRLDMQEARDRLRRDLWVGAAVLLLACSLAFLIASLIGNAVLRPISRGAQSLAASSDRLKVLSNRLAGDASETSSQAGVASAAAEQVSRSVESVATAVQEMGVNIQEIARSSAEAAQVATAAVKASQNTNARVSKLGKSNAEIGNVVKVITSIAEQTNLLALNATIEAARAGEAGKGFAVVANEVKELARETAKATDEIHRKIETINSDMNGAADAISEIGAIIRKISDLQNTIAGAVEEQTATSSAIITNLAEAVKGTSEIAANISVVAQTAKGTTAGADETKQAAREMDAMVQAIAGGRRDGVHQVDETRRN